MRNFFSHWNITTLFCSIMIVVVGCCIASYITNTTTYIIISVIVFAALAVIVSFLQWKHPQDQDKVPQISPKERIFLIGLLITSSLMASAIVVYATSIRKDGGAVSISHPTPTPLANPTQTPTSTAISHPTPTPLANPTQTPPSLTNPTQTSTCDISKGNVHAPTISSPPTGQELETALSTYESNISYLVQNCELRSLKPDDPIRNMAQSQTISTINQLDTTRNIELLNFLRTSQLIGSGQNIISFAYANFDLSGNPPGADLRDVDLSDTNMQHANLMYVNLNHANLRGADLTCASLSGANIGNVDFRDANLSGATRTDSSGFTKEGELLQGATLPGSSTQC